MAIDTLEPAMAELPRIGGSRAQSDLITNTLLAAYVITVQQQLVINGTEIHADGIKLDAADATIPQLMQHFNVTILNPQVLCGLFVGVMLVMVFCAMTMKAVGTAAMEMVQEVAQNAPGRGAANPWLIPISVIAATPVHKLSAHMKTKNPATIGSWKNGISLADPKRSIRTPAISIAPMLENV